MLALFLLPVSDLIHVQFGPCLCDAGFVHVQFGPFPFRRNVREGPGEQRQGNRQFWSRFGGEIVGGSPACSRRPPPMGGRKGMLATMGLVRPYGRSSHVGGHGTRRDVRGANAEMIGLSVHARRPSVLPSPNHMSLGRDFSRNSND